MPIALGLKNAAQELVLNVGAWSHKGVSEIFFLMMRSIISKKAFVQLDSLSKTVVFFKCKFL